MALFMFNFNLNVISIVGWGDYLISLLTSCFIIIT